MNPLLPFGRRPVQKATELVERLVTLLKGRGWRSARELAQWLDTDDRTIREAAHLSQGRIISGQKGYRLASEATIAEVQHAADWLRHQGQEMLRRASEIERAMHRRSA